MPTPHDHQDIRVGGANTETHAAGGVYLLTMGSWDHGATRRGPQTDSKGVSLLESEYAIVYQGNPRSHQGASPDIAMIWVRTKLTTGNINRTLEIRRSFDPSDSSGASSPQRPSMNNSELYTMSTTNIDPNDVVDLEVEVALADSAGYRWDPLPPPTGGAEHLTLTLRDTAGDTVLAVKLSLDVQTTKP